MKVYVASKLNHEAMWKKLREEWRMLGVEILSRWLDTVVPDDVGTQYDFDKCWLENAQDVAHADALVVYKADGDGTLRGALVEVGMALSWGIPVIITGVGVGDVHSDFGSWQFHSLVRHVADLDAVSALLREWKTTGIPL